MNHLPPLIGDLGILLLTGGLAALLFSFLRQPLIVGYLLAGFLLGPNCPFFPHVAEPESISLWGEIGVIFLLFSLGLEFSFKKLMEMGPSALVAASIEVGATFLLGTWIAHKLGYQDLESLFFGGMLAISSTTVLLRAIEDSGTKSARFAQNIFGILIVEDIFAVLLLVLLSTLAGGTEGSSGVQIVFSTLFKFAFALTVVFVIGVSVLPLLIQKTQRILSDEKRLILALGLCFIMVVGAAKLGFSPTLGAFIMGSLLAGTREARRIETLLLPVQQLFGAIFFISVGMLIEPGALARHPLHAAAFLAVILFGKSFFVTVGTLVSGKPLKPAVRSGVSMAQIGEFSFIMAALGISLGVLKKDSHSLIVMLATITALTTPHAVKRSKSIAAWVDQSLPRRWREGLDRYSASVQRSGHISDWRRMIRKQLAVVFVNSALIGAIAIGFQYGVKDWIFNKFGSSLEVRSGALLLALLLAAPFFWGVAKGGLRRGKVQKYWVNRTLRPILVLFMIFRAVVFFLLASFLFTRFFLLRFSVFALGALAVGVVLLFSDRVESVYERFVQRFLLSLSEEDTASQDSLGSDSGAGSLNPEVGALAGDTIWDSHIAVFEVSYDSLAVGKTLIELQVRERYGVTVTLIERGERRMAAPAGSERIYPKDRLHVIGTEDQFQAFREFIEVAASSIDATTADSYSLQSYALAADSHFLGQSIRASGIREKANGLVVGIERAGSRIVNPTADFKLEAGDLLWIVGETHRIRALS
ncbi:MAG: cation:proton antiporter [Cryobacterium sp.]|nr:cation:proton antiporter [Oligoflexia bacterium]